MPKGMYYYDTKKKKTGYVTPEDEGYEKHKKGKAKAKAEGKYMPPRGSYAAAQALGDMPSPTFTKKTTKSGKGLYGLEEGPEKVKMIRGKKKSPVNFDELIKKYAKRKQRGN